MLFGSDHSELVAVNMVLNVHRSHKAYRGWGEGGRGGGRGSYRYTVTTRMTPALRWESS